MKLLKKTIGHAYLKAAGWKAVGEPPDAPAYVLIAAPHTSNWDLPFMLAIAYVLDVEIRWAGKHTLFAFPYGPFMKALGGIPIVREKRSNKVQQLAGLFAKHEGLKLTVPAEGTRGRTERWKSGFYWIAREAGVPIVCGFLDFAKKEGGFGLAVMPTGNVKEDMDQIRAFYADKVGKFPEKFGPVRLREEGEDDAGATAA
ncbi:MAG: lysophospholipid acyltransferase family protein [Myxococcota bacterium]